jgi:DnaJ homolog subfamily C member 28
MENPLLDRLRTTRQTETTKRKSLADERIEEAAAQGAFDGLPGEGKPLDPKATDPNKKQPPLTAARVGSIAEQRIQAAMEDGMFENLPGAGQPLDLYDDAHVAPDMRMAFRMMKGQSLGAPWVDVQRDYEREIDRYRLWRTNNSERWEYISEVLREQLRAELPGRIAEINRLVHNLNALVPSDNLRVGLLRLEREINLLEGR